jgi:catechol 2,3-dioxygenase
LVLAEGTLWVDTPPLDLAGLLAESGDEFWEGLPAEKTIGHVHLHVGDLRKAKRFYREELGFDLTALHLKRYLGAAEASVHRALNLYRKEVPA